MPGLPPTAASLALLAGWAVGGPPSVLEDLADLDPNERRVGGGVDPDDGPGVLVQPLPRPGGPAVP